MSVTVQQRRDTAANWTSVNPVLHQGEIGAETDTGKAKIGDGATAWNSLAYWKPDGAASLPVPSGTATAGMSPLATGEGEASAWAAFPGLAPSGDATGVTDTPRIQALLNLGAAILQPGIFYTNAILSVPAGGRLSGARGTSPDVRTGVAPSLGAVIRAASGWTGSGTAPAMVQAAGAGVFLADFWLDGTNCPSGTDGVNDGGTGVYALRAEHVGAYNVSNGFRQAASSNLNDWILHYCTALVCQASGFSGRWTDGHLVGCFAQACGLSGTGNGYTVQGSQCKLIGCRGDLSQHGFYIDTSAAASFTDMVQLIGCSTQRNNLSGIYIQNSSSGEPGVPVVLSGCVMDGDGVNGTLQASGGAPSGSGSYSGNGAGGGGFAGLEVDGNATVIVTGGAVTMATRDASGGAPQYGIATKALSARVPALVSVAGMFLNAVTAPVHDAAPAAILAVGSTVHGTIGEYTDSSVLTQVAPSLTPVITTGEAGYALVNGTGTIGTWTAPNDGQMHRFQAFGNTLVTSTEAGGQIQVTYTPPGGTSRSVQMDAGGHAAGMFGWTFNAGMVAPGTTVTLSQSSALTGGAATANGEVWGS